METAAMNVPDMFGSMVFNDAAMKAKLPKDVYMSQDRECRRCRCDRDRCAALRS